MSTLFLPQVVYLMNVAACSETDAGQVTVHDLILEVN